MRTEVGREMADDIDMEAARSIRDAARKREAWLTRMYRNKPNGEERTDLSFDAGAMGRLASAIDEVFFGGSS